jgi:FkbM family methyltransferase
LLMSEESAPQAAPNGDRAGLDAYRDQQLLLRGRRPRTIFDVGANVGNTVEKYYFDYPHSIVHAFEPDPSTFSQLEARFEGHPRVQCHCLAVSRNQRSETFFINEDPATNSLLPRPASGRRYFNKTGVLSQTIEVPATTISDFCAEQGITEIDILKLDIQGGELLALKGAETLLREHKIQVLYAEVQFIPLYEGAPLFHDVAHYLEAQGFALYGLYDLVVAANGQLRFADAIFIPPAVRERVLDEFPQEPY